MVKIRLFRKEDLETLAKVYATAFIEEYGHKWTGSEMKKTLHYFYKQQPDLFFVAESENQVVGGIWGRIVPWRGGLHLKETDMAVSSKYRRKGISRMLLSKIITSALKKYKIVEFSGVAHGQKKFPMSYYMRIGLKKTSWVFIYGNPKTILKKLKG